MRIAIWNWNNVLTDLIEELKKEHEVTVNVGGIMGLDLDNHDLFIIWNEVGDWSPVIKQIRESGKKFILMQHGRRGTSRIYPPFNEKLNSDIVCAWGEADRKRLESCGVAPERIRVTGTTIFKHLKGRKEHPGINVVFSPEHWCSEVPENIEVVKALRKLKGVQIITKGLQGEHDPLLYDNPVYSQRNQPEHMEIVADVLSIADVVVGISESTFELLAQSLDIPVVIYDKWIPKACNGDDRYKEYHREYSRACERANTPRKLRREIKYALKHPEYLREERKEVVLEDGGPDNALENILNVIRELNS